MCISCSGGPEPTTPTPTPSNNGSKSGSQNNPNADADASMGTLIGGAVAGAAVVGASIAAATVYFKRLNLAKVRVQPLDVVSPQVEEGLGAFEFEEPPQSQTQQHVQCFSIHLSLLQINLSAQ